MLLVRSLMCCNTNTVSCTAIYQRDSFIQRNGERFSISDKFTADSVTPVNATDN